MTLATPSFVPRDADAPVHLVQLSDCHLLADACGTKRDVNVRQSLHDVVAQIRADGMRPDALLATGDIAHDGSSQAYAHFQAAVQDLAPSVRVTPGNRDNPAVLRASLPHWAEPVLDLGTHWRVIMLDTTVPGARHGHLNGAQFAMLDEAVAQAGDRHILVAMHHNPVIDMGEAIDTAMLDNARIMLTHLTAWHQARVLLWGHVHRAYDCRVDNMRLLACPATSFQYTVEADQYVIDPIAPGYRWLKLYNDGSIATGVKRVAQRKNGAP
ncbi:MAG: metallophosphoesterase [Burkholderiaceae bacterium]